MLIFSTFSFLHIGLFYDCLNSCAVNIPKTSDFDTNRVWTQIKKALPFDVSDAILERMKSEHKIAHDVWTSSFPDTKGVYLLRGLLKGCVIGPLDKNLGDLWVACPNLYTITKLWKVCIVRRPVIRN